MRISAGLIKLSMASILLMLSTSCTPQNADTQVHADAVAEAYNTSGLVPVRPYTRTIFSSYNF